MAPDIVAILENNTIGRIGPIDHAVISATFVLVEIASPPSFMYYLPLDTALFFRLPTLEMETKLAIENLQNKLPFSNVVTAAVKAVSVDGDILVFAYAFSLH